MERAAAAAGAAAEKTTEGSERGTGRKNGRRKKEKKGKARGTGNLGRLPLGGASLRTRGEEEARDEAGLVQEKEERCWIGPVKKTREDWIGEEPEVGGDKRGVAAAARRMGQDP